MMQYASLFYISLLFLLLAGVQGTSDPFNPIPCTVDDNCRVSVNGSICSSSNNCTCPDTAPIFVNATQLISSYCLIARNETGGNCTFHQQCDYDNGRCLTDLTCGCKVKFMSEKGLCVPDKKSALIPMVVGIVIGVCVIATVGIYLILSRRKRSS